MIVYNEIKDTNIVEITLQGPISRQAYQQLRQQFEPFVARHGSVRILETTERSFLSLMMTCYRDVDFCRRYLPAISHAAIVGDPWWVSTWMWCVTPYLSLSVNSFRRSQLTLAKEWLLTAQDVSFPMSRRSSDFCYQSLRS